MNASFAHTAEALIAVIQGVLTPDLLHPAYRTKAKADNPLYGHCTAASEALYFLLGGPKSGLKAWYVRDQDGTTHWWLQDQAGRRYDPTREQYTCVGRKPPYERGLLGRAGGFMGMRIDLNNRYGFGRRPSLRAAEILKRVEKT